MATTSTTTILSRVAVFLAVVAIAMVLLLASGVQAGSRGRATSVHVVGQGETLWSIATAYTAPGDDVRATIYDIQRMNDLDTSLILIGQPLTVPVD